MTASASGILVRYGEIFLKKGRKQFFLDSLAGNLERTLNRVAPDLKLTRPYGRFLAVPKAPDGRIEDPQRAAEALAAVFGVVWAGPVEIIRDPTPKSLTEAVVAYAEVHRRRRHKTFKIETRRADKQFPLTSIQCNQRLGSAVWEAQDGLEVDIHDPDLTLRVEIRTDIGFIYGAQVKGVGGLPVGSNGRALLLLSGGIDSPVAGWLTQKRGVAIDAITFLSPPYTGPQAHEKVVTLAGRLGRPQRRLRLWTVELTAIQEQYRDKAPGDQLVLLYRRSMFRIADKIAARHKHQALITGESLGQVASQTVPNLHVIGSVANRPVLRPLITYDKVETIELARKIDTYETSILPFDDCCSLFVPKHPELRGSIENLDKLEAEIQPGELEAKALAEATLLELPERK